MRFLSNSITSGSDQQVSAIRKNAPQEDAVQAIALRTAGGLEFTLAVIADGEGGPNARAAADLAVRTVVETVRRSTGNLVPPILQRAVEAANTALLSSKSGASTSSGATVALTVAAIYRSRLYLAHAGHTSAYLLQGGKPTRLTGMSASASGGAPPALGSAHPRPKPGGGGMVEGWIAADGIP